MIDFDVNVDPAELQGKAAAAIRELLGKVLPEAARDATPVCRRVYRQALKSEETYRALFNPRRGGLQGEFGLEDPDTQVEPIVDAVVRSLTVRVKGVQTRGAGSSFGLGWLGKRLGFEEVTDYGGLAVTIVPDGLIEELIEMDQAAYYSEAKRGGWVLWLDWLLNSGTEPVVFGYMIRYSADWAEDYSRTGQAVMQPANGKEYSVPKKYAGTPEKNWITIAAEKAAPEIQKILEASVKGRLT